MTPATIEEARSAKAKLGELLVDLPELSALGIAVLDDGFGVKVNLTTPTSFPIPAEVDGVPVVVDVVGIICPL